MEQKRQSPEVYDFRQHDQIWKRVAPGLEPYPAMQQREELPAVMNPVSDHRQGAMMLRQESQLPGADPNPCCMGTAAEEMLEVLAGFIEEELRDQQVYQVMMRQAPSWARQRIRELAAEEGGHAKRLMAVYYLIKGECYHPAFPIERICVGTWCAALRERYHEAACDGLNYARAADETTDPCLSRLLSELSREEYHHADELLTMLQRSLRG